MELALHANLLAVARTPHYPIVIRCFRFATRPLELPSK
jgi:hypothetical protein